jgi:hypothetical protein
MPEELKPQVLDPAKSNADIARKQADQDLAGKSTATGEFGEATDALDKLAALVQPKPDAPKPDAPKPDAPKPDAPKPDAPPPPPDEDAQHLKRAEDLFKDSPALPPNASPKSAEAFSAIKIRAAKEVALLEEKLQEIQKAAEQSKTPTPERLQEQKELEDLRQWRAKMDVDFDPKFKEYDKAIAQQRDFIYAQLAKSPAFTPQVIEQIKKVGGPDAVNLSKLFEAAGDPTLQRLVEAKVADIEMAKYNRDQAVLAAKSNVREYLTTREAELSKGNAETRQTTVTRLDSMLGSLEWFANKKAEAGADAAAKKEAEEHNKFLGDLKGQLAAAVQDDTPEMKAILLTGMAQLFHTQRRIPSLEAALAAKDKELSEVKTKWEAVKNSSRSRLAESQAPANGIQTPASGSNPFERASDALDRIAQTVMQQRASASAGQ